MRFIIVLLFIVDCTTALSQSPAMQGMLTQMNNQITNLENQIADANRRNK